MQREGPGGRARYAPSPPSRLPFRVRACVRACVRVGISVARARAHLGCAGKSLWSVWRWCHGSFQRPVPRLEEH